MDRETLGRYFWLNHEIKANRLCRSCDRYRYWIISSFPVYRNQVSNNGRTDRNVEDYRGRD